MNTCFSFLKKYKLMNETSYPYVASYNKCLYNSTKGILKVKGYANVAKNDPNEHIKAL